MPASTPKRIPTYRLHKSSGRAVVTLPIPGMPRGRDVFLGRYGSPESKQKYAQTIAHWTANGDAPSDAADDISIVELIARYWSFATTYYNESDERYGIRAALKPLSDLYGTTAARDFGPLAFKAVRQKMVEKGWMRGTVNDHCQRIKRLFAWAVENELVPAAVHHALQAVKGLRYGRTNAPESEPVKPVADDLVDAIRDHVSEQVWTMIELQRLTGMRPGEATIMRTCDIETSGKVWLYRPAQHKNLHRGHERIIAIGPRAQAILKPWLRANLNEYLFQPAEAEEARRQRQHEARRTPLSYGNAPGTNRKAKPKVHPGRLYSTEAYGRAIRRACDLAFPVPADITKPAEVKAWRASHRWSANQLRHNAATAIRKQFGLEAAGAVLGHRLLETSQIYSEVNHARARQIMAEVG